MKLACLFTLGLIFLGCSSDPQAAWYERVDTTAPSVTVDSFGHKEMSYDFLDKYSDEDFKLTMLPEAAFEYLAKTDQFASTAVGFAGTPSRGSLCIEALMARDDAADVCRSLLDRGKIPGQLYALCGLYLSDRVSYEKLVRAYRADTRLVNLFDGCTVAPVEVSDIVNHIDNGYWPWAFAPADKYDDLRPDVEADGLFGGD